MNKSELLREIVSNVRKKHPWQISEEKYLDFFGPLPREYLEERIAYDNLLEKSRNYKKLHLVLTQVKIEVHLTLDECIRWEIARWEDAAAHNIMPNDIKKLLNS